MSDSAILLRAEQLADILLDRIMREPPYDLVALVVYRKRRVIFTDSAWRASVMGFVRSQASRGVKTVLVR